MDYVCKNKINSYEILCRLYRLYQNKINRSCGLLKEGRMAMFYLTTYSTHFIYGYMTTDIWYRTTQIAREKTRCRHMGYSFRLAARFFYMHHPTDRITHTTAFVTPVVEYWLEPEITQSVYHKGSIRRPFAI